MKHVIKKVISVAALLAIGGCCAFVFAGCTSTTAEWGGESVVYGLDGAPLVDKDGNVQKVKNPVKLSSWRHWIKTLFTAAKLTVKKDEIELAMDGYKAEPSEELNKVIETSFKGASELAAKIGAAIATSGGSVAGAGIAIEKAFQPGGERIRAAGVRVESLAKIAEMGDDGSIRFA